MLDASVGTSKGDSSAHFSVSQVDLSPGPFAPVLRVYLARLLPMHHVCSSLHHCLQHVCSFEASSIFSACGAVHVVCCWTVRCQLLVEASCVCRHPAMKAPSPSFPLAMAGTLHLLRCVLFLPSLSSELARCCCRGRVSTVKTFDHDALHLLTLCLFKGRLTLHCVVCLGGINSAFLDAFLMLC